MKEKIWSTMLLVAVVMGLVGCSVIPSKPSKSENAAPAEVEADSLLMAKLADALSIATEETRVSKIDREEVKNQVMDLSASVAAVETRTKQMDEILTAVTTSLKAEPPMLTESDVVTIVNARFDENEAAHDGTCKCGCQEKIAELAKEIEPLKERLVALEARPAYASSSYGSYSSSSTVSSGGSTGSVKSGGSTGKAQVTVGELTKAYDAYLQTKVKSGGSTGSVASGGSTGSLRRTQTQTASPPVNAHIVVVTTPTCERCGPVSSEVSRVYAASGWSVEVQSEDQRAGVSYPYYRVCVGDRCEEIQCSVSELSDTVRQILTKWNVSFDDASSVRATGVRGPASGDSSRNDRQPLRTAYQLASSPLRAGGAFVAQWGSGRALDVARASAEYRAANRIKGHSAVDLRSGLANGVGWASNNPQPRTCFWNQRGQGAYASVQGSDGYYATLVLP